MLLAASAQAAIVVNIDKSSQRMTVAVDGETRYVWPVSTGRAGYDTPNGTFKVNRMDADHQSQEWDNAPMPNTMFFDLHGHAIHGFSDVKHLGSAGVARLRAAGAGQRGDAVCAGEAEGHEGSQSGRVRADARPRARGDGAAAGTGGASRGAADASPARL